MKLLLGLLLLPRILRLRRKRRLWRWHARRSRRSTIPTRVRDGRGGGWCGPGGELWDVDGREGGD